MRQSMRSRRHRSARPLPLLLALLWLAAGCGSRPPKSPILGPTGRAVVEGPLTLTPIRFTTTEHQGRPTVIDAEEGRLRVPERHRDPGGREIDVHFVRFRSTSERPGPPIVYLAGGPGGSGTWSASGDRFPLFQRMREVADVVALDQRGTWSTASYMVCPGSWSYPLDRPLEGATLEAALAPFLRECADHWGAAAELSAYNTLESVADLEALRVALRAEELTLWGISYGTHLALAYLREHPEKVHRAILAGVEGPDHTYKLPARVDEVLRRVDAAIRDDPEASAAVPDFIGSLEELIARLEQEPVAVEVQHPETGAPVSVVVGPEDVRRAVFSSLGEREDIEQLLENGLPVLRGDLTGVARFAIEDRLDNRELVMSLSMDCASGASDERRAEIRAQEDTAHLGNPNIELAAACAGWPVEELGDRFRSAVRADVPVLFISGTLDASTPPANAEDVLPGFPRGHHLVIEGGSHDDDLFLSSPKIADAMIGFLRGEEPPPRIVLEPLRFELP